MKVHSIAVRSLPIVIRNSGPPNVTSYSFLPFGPDSSIVDCKGKKYFVKLGLCCYISHCPN